MTSRTGDLGAYLTSLRESIQQLSQLTASGKEGFEREFELLKKFDEDMKKDRQTFVTSNKYCNRNRNRYQDILPNESTMCKVSGDNQNDYFNGNYVCPLGNLFAYICCQAPLASTADHFWNVVFYYGAVSVVMLCNECENGTVKCERYWPTTMNVGRMYGHIEVKLTSEETYGATIIRKFVITNCLNHDSRQIVHFQYTGWPDFGVPDEADDLVRLIRQVESVNTTAPREGEETPPIVVHCSAGVGRTGTFLAVHTALTYIAHKKELNIFEIVKQLKQQRCGMVQRMEQYKFIYTVLLTELEKRNEQNKPVQGPAPPPHMAHSNPTFNHAAGVYSGPLL